jgi:hypothetical protein
VSAICAITVQDDELEQPQYLKGADVRLHDDNGRGKVVQAVLAGKPVCPQRPDQENPLPVRDNDGNGRTTGRAQIRRRAANPLEPFKAYVAARVVDACLGFCLDDESAIARLRAELSSFVRPSAQPELRRTAEAMGGQETRRLRDLSSAG